MIVNYKHYDYVRVVLVIIIGLNPIAQVSVQHALAVFQIA